MTDDTSFLRIGHRGAPSHFLENTFRSFQKAMEIGVDMIEFDVRITRDRHLVVSHSKNLRNIWRQKRRVPRATLGEIQTFRIGDGDRVPLFSEVLQMLAGRILMNIDLKDRGEEKQVVDLIAQHHAEDQVLISSHYSESLRRIKDLDPAIRVGLSFPRDFFRLSIFEGVAPLRMTGLYLLGHLMPRALTRGIDVARADAVMLYYRLLTPGLVRWIQDKGCKVYAWTIDDLYQIRRCMAMGVDGIASNVPHLLLAPQK